MPRTGPIHVEVAYAAMTTYGRERNPTPRALSTTVPVGIPEVEGSAAPIAVEAAWPVGGFPPRMSWRVHGGALWRPLVGPDGATLDDPGGFARGVAQAGLPPGRRVHGAWTDYPFAVVAPDRGSLFGLHGRTPFDATPEDADGYKVKSHNREAAVTAARRKAARDMLVVDGVMHVRTLPPVWAVGSRNRLQLRPGHVRLAIPDFAGHSDWFASFPLDRRDEALEFAGLHAARVSGIEWLGGEPAQVVEHPVELFNVGGPFPDTRADDLRRVYEVIEENWKGAEVSRFGRRFLKAYADVGALVDAIEAEGPGAGWPDEAEAAVRAVAEAGDPDWSRTWPYAAEVVETMRSIAQRCDLSNRLAAEAAAEAIASLGR